MSRRSIRRLREREKKRPIKKDGLNAELGKKDYESGSGSDKKKDEEEELDCSHPEVVNKYQQAGAVANGALLLRVIQIQPSTFIT